MFAASVRINAGAEADVRTVVARDDRARRIAQELRARQRQLVIGDVGIDLIAVRLELNGLEAVRRIVGRAASPNGV